MKKLVALILVGVLILAASGCIGGKTPTSTPTTTPSSASSPTSSPAPSKVYKMSVVVGPNSPWGQAAQMWADEIEKRTNGRVKIKIYFSGQLFAGKQTNEFVLLSQGVADFAVGSTINWAPQIPELNLFTLPFFFPEGNEKGDIYKAVDAVEEGKAGEMLSKILEQKGVIPLAWGENGFRQVTNWKKPIKTPEDLSGLKIRVVGSPIFIDTFKALGADPTEMNWGDAITAFQQRVVDGQENPINIVIIPYKIHEFHKYMTVWDYAIDPLIFAVNKKTWESFDPETQKIVKEAAIKAAKWEKAMARVGLDDGTSLKILKEEYNYTPEILDPFEYLKDKGMEITFLTPEERSEFKNKVRSVYSEWVPKIGEDLVNAAISDIKNAIGIEVEIPS
ncbi:DctP family TRAP transporter solute-binding subunit [Thermococcus sp. MV5]|uniref:DctP family TRAP transporter solute-binding subunit n=1 Tax=Thermococcus sp. MV5 TaxID=1638272 RepID=UPI0014393CE0|nr:DctP family TRAP transporter solute-binding subunit [Thermococcus sp. MV5]NJE26576.1 DctP family TRAP transporter solute-binding subunit [Thermococcus sp. MV5]